MGFLKSALTTVGIVFVALIIVNKVPALASVKTLINS